MNTYWFYLEPYTFLFAKKESALIYNSLSYESRKFTLGGKLENIIMKLSDSNNMYCIEVSQEDLTDTYINQFISFVRETFSGDLIAKVSTKNKPVIMVPDLNLQGDVEKLRYDDIQSIGDNIKSYIRELNLYLTGNGTTSKILYSHKQFNSCYKYNNHQLPLHSIKSLLHQLKDSYLSKISLLGGNIFEYPDLIPLVDELDKISITKTFYVYYNDIPTNIQEFNFLTKELNSLKVIIDYPVDPKIVSQIITKLEASNCNKEWLFVIRSKEEFEETEHLVTNFKLEKCEIKPLFTGDNIDFFKEYIYINVDDISTIKLSRREIFINQVLNVFDFGKLTVLADGKIYGNVNFPSIGNINHSILEMLYEELDLGTSWRRIRNQKPCSDCVYQWICPSPSNFELIIGKPNLCHIY